MAISKIKKNNITRAGFTLVELVVVLGGLSALTAVTVPGILNQIKLSKIESTKALMNGYAADCLGKYRTSENPSETFVNKVEPEFDIVQLENLGFTVKNRIKNEITIKVENSFITSALKTILSNFNVEDLYINEPPIDEIIGKVLIKNDYEI